MTYLRDLIEKNGHKLVMFNETKEGRSYISVFDYSVAYGGTYDSHRFYNNYVIEL